ncbi:MAG: hypothetical protein LW650_00700 [Planctomycetaceae bacterium]|nr:hypothetical protein [Planctomycetaceae bacterium]
MSVQKLPRRAWSSRGQAFTPARLHAHSSPLRQFKHPPRRRSPRTYSAPSAARSHPASSSLANLGTTGTTRVVSVFVDRMVKVRGLRLQSLRSDHLSPTTSLGSLSPAYRPRQSTRRNSGSLTSASTLSNTSAET